MGDQNNFTGKTLRVAFDVSVLGYSLFGSAGKTGVYRMVYSLVEQLLKKTDIELSFCAADSLKVLYYALEFTSDKFPAPFLASSTLSPLHKVLGPLVWELQRAQSPSLVQRLQIRIGSHLLRALDRAPLEPKHLRGMDVFHSSFYPLPKCSQGIRGLRRFLTVCDVANLRNPEYASGGQEFLQQVLGSLLPEDQVIAISQTTKDHLCALRPDLEPEQVHVVPLAASPAFLRQEDPAALKAIRLKYHLADFPFFLCVSTLDKRKNLVRLLEAFHFWVLQEKESDTLLVLAGFQGNDATAIQQYLVAHPDLRSRVVLPGFIPDSDLRDLYSAALAFVYPSLEEGFGLPVLEAMQCGLPVAVSQSGALEEVAGESGVLFDPASAESIASALHGLFTDSRRRERLSLSGRERAKQFSWSKTVDQLITVYSR